MGMSDSAILQAGMADEARITRPENPVETKRTELAEKFAGAFLSKGLAELTGFTTRLEYSAADGSFMPVPSTVADMAVDAMDAMDSFEAGVAVVLACLQLCAKKGDVDALRAVGVLAQAWAAENTRGLL